MSEDFFRYGTGILHIGANSGQEREIYNNYGKNVLWIEPIPDIFAQLTENIKPFPKQKALNYLLTDVDDKEYKFYLSNNAGESSSIFDFHLHKDIWPQVWYTGELQLKSIALNTLVEKESIDIKNYQILVMDTQGSELLILKGGNKYLSGFKYIKAEAADFESYKDCCLIDEITEYLKEFGFIEHHRNLAIRKEGVGAYYDIVYVNNK